MLLTWLQVTKSWGAKNKDAETHYVKAKHLLTTVGFPVGPATPSMPTLFLLASLLKPHNPA